MKERMDQFDDMIRNKMAEELAHVPFEFKEEYWDAARLLLEDDERRRRALWWWWALAGALTLAVAWAAVSHEAPPPPSVPAPAMAEKNIPPHATQLPQNASSSYHTQVPAAKLQQPVVTRPSGWSPSDSKAASIPAPQLETPFLNERSLPTGTASVPPVQGVKSAPVLLPSLPLENVSSTEAASITVSSFATAPIIRVSKTHQRRQFGLVALAGTRSGWLEKEKIAVGAGLSLGYRLSRNWTVHTEVLWRRWKGQYAPLLHTDAGVAVNQVMATPESADGVTVSASTLQYSFGYHQNYTLQRIKAIHNIEIPIYLQRHQGKWALEMGGTLSYLWKQGRQEQQFEAASLQSARLAASEYELVRPVVDRRWAAGAIAGVQYALWRNVTIGARGVWKASVYQAPASINSDKLYTSAVVAPANSLTRWGADVRLQFLF